MDFNKKQPTPRLNYWKLNGWKSFIDGRDQERIDFELDGINAAKGINCFSTKWFGITTSQCVYRNENLENLRVIAESVTELVFYLSHAGNLRRFIKEDHFLTLLIQTVKHTAQSDNTQDLQNLMLLSLILKECCDKRQGLLSYIVKDRKDLLRFAKYIAKFGESGLMAAITGAQWIDYIPQHLFKSERKLSSSFTKNKDKLWCVGVSNEDSYINFLNNIIKDTQNKRFLFVSGFWNNDQLGICKAIEKGFIIISVDGKGFIDEIKMFSTEEKDKFFRKAKQLYATNFVL